MGSCSAMYARGSNQPVEKASRGGSFWTGVEAKCAEHICDKDYGLAAECVRQNPRVKELVCEEDSKACSKYYCDLEEGGRDNGNQLDQLLACLAGEHKSQDDVLCAPWRAW